MLASLFLRLRARAPTGRDLPAQGSALGEVIRTMQALKGRNQKFHMPQSLAKIYLHIIFSTKGREPLLNKLVLPELFPYIGGILGNLDCIPVQIGGDMDHAHILCSLSRN